MFATFVFVCVGGVMPSKYQNWHIHYLYQENFHAATVGVSSWMILKSTTKPKAKYNNVAPKLKLFVKGISS